VVDIRLWTIRFVVVDTRDWLAGRRVLVAPNCFRLVDWSKRMVRLDLTRDAVRNSPGYTPSQPIDEMYAAQLHAYYARPVR
jgi:hypothetical protein